MAINFVLFSTVSVQMDEVTVRKIAQFEEEFFAECDLQLTKVNTFFAG